MTITYLIFLLVVNSGLIFCWGRHGGNGTWGCVNITLPISFNHLLCIATTGIDSEGEFSNGNPTTIRGTTRSLITNLTKTTVKVQSASMVLYITVGI